MKILDGIDLSVEEGQIVSIIGPNGCGKSTILNIIAGLLDASSGDVQINGKSPKEAKIGFVFQNYSESLFPWLRNVDNIAFSLISTKYSRKEKRERVKSFVESIGLSELPLDKYPYQCSAGQQQLVALARELIYEPDILLLDEPFASLDYERRLSQQEYLLDMWRRTKTTILFVSHEIDEAIYLSDTVILLSKNPTVIFQTHLIPLTRPRVPEILSSESFYQIKIPILNHFREVISNEI